MSTRPVGLASTCPAPAAVDSTQCGRNRCDDWSADQSPLGVEVARLELGERSAEVEAVVEVRPVGVEVGLAVALNDPVEPLAHAVGGLATVGQLGVCGLELVDLGVEPADLGDDGVVVGLGGLRPRCSSKREPGLAEERAEPLDGLGVEGVLLLLELGQLLLELLRLLAGARRCSCTSWSRRCPSWSPSSRTAVEPDLSASAFWIASTCCIRSVKVVRRRSTSAATRSGVFFRKS